MSKIRVNKDTCLEIIQFVMLPIQWAAAKAANADDNTLDTDIWENLYEMACNVAVDNMVNLANTQLLQIYEL